jgi:uncharacterized small protein (DUF1192 family)
MANKLEIMSKQCDKQRVLFKKMEMELNIAKLEEEIERLKGQIAIQDKTMNDISEQIAKMESELS